MTQASPLDLTRLPSSSRGLRCVCAAEPKKNQPKKPAEKEIKIKLDLPEHGYFSMPDIDAPVHAPFSGEGRGNPYVKGEGGRYAPEFVWQMNWREQIAYQQNMDKWQKEGWVNPQAKTERSLNISSLSELNRMDLDLSDKLLPRAPPAAEAPAAAGQKATWQGREAQMRQTQTKAAALRAPAQNYPRMPPRRNEPTRWQRTQRFAKRGVVAAPVSPEEKAAYALKVQADRDAYARYKQQLLLYCVGLCTTLSAAAFALQSRELAISYSVGAFASVVYLNMLNRSIDGFGSSEGGSLASQPRLLIPLVLAMGFNRWNTLAADSAGLHLELMPMLLGFLTYKGAVLAKGAQDLFADLSGSSRPDGAQRSLLV